MYMSWLGRMGPPENLKESFQILLRGLFAVVALASMLEVSIPSALNIAARDGASGVVWAMFVTAIKSTLFVGALQLFISKVFFVDAGNPLGTVTLFLFVVSLFQVRSISRRGDVPAGPSVG